MAKSKVVVAVAVILMVMKGTVAEKFTVGDDNGWTIPPSPDFYSSWVAKHTFARGDSLGRHTVAMVTSKEAYDKCDPTLDKKAQIFTEAVEIPLNRPGEYLFFCTVGSHCKNGQKLAINVVEAAVSGPESSTAPTAPASGPGPAPGSTQGSSPPPEKNSAPGVFTMSTTFVSFLALLAANLLL